MCRTQTISRTCSALSVRRRLQHLSKQGNRTEQLEVRCLRWCARYVCGVQMTRRLTWYGDRLRSCLNRNSVSVNLVARMRHHVRTNDTVANIAVFRLARAFVNLLLVRMTFAPIVNLQLVQSCTRNDFCESPARTHDLLVLTNFVNLLLVLTNFVNLLSYSPIL